jgi:hypothetical protein
MFGMPSVARNYGTDTYSAPLKAGTQVQAKVYVSVVELWHDGRCVTPTPRRVRLQAICRRTLDEAKTTAVACGVSKIPESAPNGNPEDKREPGLQSRQWQIEYKQQEQAIVALPFHVYPGDLTALNESVA